MKITIHIMTHGNYDMLADCVHRIKEFTLFDYDLIISDDASNPPVKVDDATIIYLPRRSNCCNLRNVGMEMAKTEWVFWLDNDTLVNDNWFGPYLGEIQDNVGLIGQKKDARLIRRPFLPLTQAECMTEYQFAYDYNHTNGEADFITSYAVLVRKSAYRPTYCYNMPTPCLDPELGAVVKSQGYKVVVCDEAPLSHVGSATPRPHGKNYLHYLSRNFTRWYNFWEPHANKIWELYRGIPVEYKHDANEPARIASMGRHQDYDKDFEVIPEEYQYDENK